MPAQVIKRYTRRRVVGILHRVVRGTQEAAVEARLRFTQEGDEAALINTAYIERPQAIFSSRSAPPVRSTQAAVRHEMRLEAGMWLIGTLYNFCRAHRSLRLAGGDSGTAEGLLWLELRLKLLGSPITAGGFTNCLSLPFLRLYPSGAGDDRNGCWRLLMYLDYSPRLHELLPPLIQVLYASL
jgi:hypothetical protein